MGFVSPNGSLNCSQIPITTDTAYVEDSVVCRPNVEERLQDREYVEDALKTMGTTSLLRQPDMAQILAKYAEGMDVKTVFFHQQHSTSVTMSHPNTLDDALDPVHSSLLMIKNFILRAEDEFTFNFDENKLSSNYTGSAYIYPGFIPNVGDFFFVEIDPGKVYVFRIATPPKRLTIRTGSMHYVQFVIVRQLTADLSSKINAVVNDVCYFQLGRFLNEPTALLTSDEIHLYEKLIKWRKVLVQHYFDEFFDYKDYRSIVPPGECFNGIKLFDPYIVDFILELFSIESGILEVRPLQLVRNPECLSRSLWHALLDPDLVPSSLMVTRYHTKLHLLFPDLADINALCNKPYLELCPGGEHRYPFDLPTQYDKTAISIPDMVMQYLDTETVDGGKISPSKVLAITEAIRASDRTTQFYYIPVLVFFIDRLIHALDTGENTVMPSTVGE